MGMKKRAALITVMILVFCLTGCKGSSKSGVQDVSSKEYVYKVTDCDMTGESQGTVNLLKAGDAVYGYEYVWQEDSNGEKVIFYKIIDNGMEKLFEIPQEESASFSSFVIDTEGSVYTIKNVYKYIGEIDEETGEYIGDGGDGDYLDEYFLTKFDKNGSEVFSNKLDDIPELQKIKEEAGYFSAYDVILSKNSIYINCCGYFVEFDQDGSFQRVIISQEGKNELEGASLYPMPDGKIMAVVYGEEATMLAEADMERGTLGEPYKVPGIGWNYSYYPGMNYDFYLTDTYGVYGLNLGDEDKTCLMNFVDSDFACWGIYNLVPINEKEFYASYDDEETGNMIMARFTKVDPADVKDKQEIVFAMAYTNWSVRSEVIKFNKNNDEYRIILRDYSALYATEEDNESGLTRLNADIISGKIPDIILLDDTMPIDSYISKGMLEDLKPYIEKDSEMKLEDFMPNIIEAYSVDGKLYSLVPTFSISTLLAKTSDVGPERGWTVQEAMELWDSKPEGTEFINGTTRSTMLQECLQMSSSQFIDRETGKCSFNSDEFIQMLEFLNRFPEEIDDEYFSDDYWQSYDTQWREGRTITSSYYLGDIGSYNRAKQATFGEDITMIGFPSADNDGSAIVSGIRLAMSAKSKNKEGAWSFLRTFLLDEYQSDIYGFPISRKQLDITAQKAMERPSYIDENGTKVEYDDIFYLGDVEVTVEPMTREEVDAFLEQLYSFTKVQTVDRSLQQIIEEEAASYFAGQKSAKEVADIIQSRVQIYVNETR